MPRVPRVSGEIAAGGSLHQPHPTVPLRVLLVDDHVIITELVAHLLAGEPRFEVVGSATNAHRAVERARELRPDIVVMDFELPDANGATATRAILAELPLTRVVMLTGSDRPGAYVAARDAGCSAWIRKTDAAISLVETMRQVACGVTPPFKDTSVLPEMDELVVHYQPVVDLLTQRVVSLEALVRWRHPSRGLLPPAEFLPIAEDAGYMPRIGERVVEEAAGQLCAWQRKFPLSSTVTMSVNLGASAVSNPGMADSIRAALAVQGLDPHNLVVEITETTLLEETPKTLATLYTLKALGVQLALDDFGTAFSSLSYLRRFPFDVIKIDHSFTAELPESRRAVLLVESISQVADGLGLTAIAEGIERPAQAECLMGAGWQYGQGYLYARPGDAAAVEPLLRSSLHGRAS